MAPHLPFLHLLDVQKYLLPYKLHVHSCLLWIFFMLGVLVDVSLGVRVDADLENEDGVVVLRDPDLPPLREVATTAHCSPMEPSPSSSAILPPCASSESRPRKLSRSVSSAWESQE